MKQATNTPIFGRTTSSRLYGWSHSLAIVGCVFSLCFGAASAEGLKPEDVVTSTVSPLPEDPGAHLALPDAALPEAPGRQAGRVAPLYAVRIPAGWEAQPLSARDTVILGLRDLPSFDSLLSIVVSAGYSDLRNGEPNYGRNGVAFSKRLGATALRSTSSDVFSEVILAPMLHDDPRYYIEGPEHNVFHRTLHAALRPFLTRTTDGRTTVNAPFILGSAFASALSYTYYPDINRNFHDTASTYGNSFAGSAIGAFVSEFTGDLLQIVHLKKQ